MNIKTIAGLAVAVFGLASVRAATVYELTTGPGNDYYPQTRETGDELHLAGTDRIIESFSFDYFANYSQADGLTFRLYANNGALINGNRVPGDLLDSRTLDVTTGVSRVAIGYQFDPANVLPDTITYTVTFGGIESDPLNRAGLILPNAAPTIGTSFDDVWQRTGPGTSDWELIHVTDLGGNPVIGNFKATVGAVPEPGTVALMALGGLALLVTARRR